DQLVRARPDRSGLQLRFPGMKRDHAYRYAVLLWEQEGTVHVSSRSMREGPARELAEYLVREFGGSGGGHLTFGGAQVVAPLAEVGAAARGWLNEHRPKPKIDPLTRKTRGSL